MLPAPNDEFLSQYEASIDAIFARCAQNAPNFAVTAERFKASVNKTLLKFAAASSTPPSVEETLEFLSLLQSDDLFMTLACADGNERAWWEFDQNYRGYLERLARHLAKTDADARDVIDCVYIELYGTRFVDGERVSKFAAYSGRGSLKGWLRTVTWHTLVDMHRGSQEEVSLDEMTENAGEGAVQANFANQVLSGGDGGAVEQIARDRYRTVTSRSIEAAFSSLEDHEKLLLLYYHVEQLRLREIAWLAQNEQSGLGRWFQRKVKSRIENPQGRVHESTVMRWLDRSYAKVLRIFKSELESTHKLSSAEVQICMDLVTEDLGGRDLFQNLTV
ncbi:MAG TPA: hypothetical protein VMZ26_10000 [Pyrinomonadaceae bacterium]|nr:hypothetical protein [Pyrinomonadaceae bacterium]